MWGRNHWKERLATRGEEQAEHYLLPEKLVWGADLSYAAAVPVPHWVWRDTYGSYVIAPGHAPLGNKLATCVCIFLDQYQINKQDKTRSKEGIKTVTVKV